MGCVKRRFLLTCPLAPHPTHVALSQIIAHHYSLLGFTLHLLFNNFLLSTYYELGTVGAIVEKAFPKSICL